MLRSVFQPYILQRHLVGLCVWSWIQSWLKCVKKRLRDPCLSNFLSFSVKFVRFVLLCSEEVQSHIQEVHGALNRFCFRLTNIWLSKQNPKYSFLNYHATQHEWNKTCILLEEGKHDTHSCFLLTLWTHKVRGRENQNPDWMRWSESEPSLDAAMVDIFMCSKHSVLPHAAQQLKKKRHIQTR